VILLAFQTEEGLSEAVVMSAHAQLQQFTLEAVSAPNMLVMCSRLHSALTQPNRHLQVRTRCQMFAALMTQPKE
jgi:hypothetical protein